MSGHHIVKLCYLAGSLVRESGLEDGAVIENPVEELWTLSEEGLLTAANSLNDAETGENDLDSLQLRGSHREQIISGLGVSLGIHITMLALAMLMNFFFPPPQISEKPFITLVMIEPVGFGSSPGSGGSGAEGSEISHEPLQGVSLIEDKSEEIVEEGSDTASEQVVEPVKDSPVLYKVPPPKDRRRTARSHKSVAGRSSRKPSEQTEPSISPAVSPYESQSPSQGDDGLREDSYASIAGDGTGAGSDVASGGGGLRGGMGAVPKELDAGLVDRPPAAIRTIEPEYPHTARQMGISGRVVVKLLVRKDGSVDKASVIEAMPPGVFERSTLEAIHRWKFHPGRYRGVAVATWVVQSIQFRLSR